MKKRNPFAASNKALLRSWLIQHNIEHEIFDDQSNHIRILGPISIIDIWPSTMRYRTVQGEYPSEGSHLLERKFNEEEVKRLLSVYYEDEQGKLLAELDQETFDKQLSWIANRY